MLAEVFLYVILHDDNSNGERFRTKMPDMETCLQVVESSKIGTPQSTSGDYEAMGVIFCSTKDFHRHYSDTWYLDKVEK